MSANATGALLCEKAVRAAVQVLAVRKQLGCVLQCVAVCCSVLQCSESGAGWSTAESCHGGWGLGGGWWCASLIYASFMHALCMNRRLDGE